MIATVGGRRGDWYLRRWHANLAAATGAKLFDAGMFAARPNDFFAARAFEFDRGPRRRSHDRFGNLHLALTFWATLFGACLVGRRLHRRLAARANKFNGAAGTR